MSTRQFFAFLVVLSGSWVSCANGQQDNFDELVIGSKFAPFAEGAYQEQPGPIGEYTASDAVKRDSGFQAVTFSKGDEVVVAFAGTDRTSWADIKTDIRAGTQIAKPKQFEEALAYVKEAQQKFPGTRITVTGHSLGGQLALYVGGVLNVDAFAYNAPAPNLRMRTEVLAAELRSKETTKATSMNFSSKESLMCRLGQTQDIVSEFFEHYGDTVFVPATIAGTGADSGRDVIEVYHDMSRMTQDLQKAAARGRSDYEQTVADWNSMSSAKSRWSLPSIDFRARTTSGGGAPPIPLPGIPGARQIVPHQMAPDSLYR